MKKKWITVFVATYVIALVGCKIVLESEPTVNPESVAVESITLETTTLTIALGETMKLTATVTPSNADNKIVIWSSSDASIAKVGSDGTVTAIKAGTATITAQAGDKKATCVVTVNGADVVNPGSSVAVESITLEATTLTIALGETMKLTATVTPSNADNKIVIWSSSDASIAKVGSDGTVTAIKAGTATITAQAGDKKATCAVTVPLQDVGGADDNDNENDFVINDGILVKYIGASSAVTIPAKVTQIGSEAFKGCSNLTTVNIPASVTSIGGNAFYGCTSLTSVEIPDSVTDIGQEAFSKCKELKAVTISKNVSSIEMWVFSGCTSLASVTIPASVKSIEYGAFIDCSGLTEVTMPDGLEIIRDCVFYDCSKLTEITIPNGVKSIGDSAFQNCLRLAKVSIPASVKNIGPFSFANCSINLVVYYDGTQNQWNAIEGIDIIKLAKGTTIRCNDTAWSVK